VEDAEVRTQQTAVKEAKVWAQQEREAAVLQVKQQALREHTAVVQQVHPQL
jgi:hypothetical protein